MAKGDEKLWAILNEKLDTLRATGQLAEAIRIGETAVELAERAFHSESVEYALSLEKLGQLFDLAGDRGAARRSLLKAHAVRSKCEPPGSRALFRSARRLAFLSDDLGGAEDALHFYEQAITLGLELDEVPHSDLGTLLNNAALIYRRTGRDEAAEPCYHRALELYEKQVGPEHPDVASVLNNLGVFYTNAQRYDEAERAHLRALAIREKTLPPKHSDIAQSQCNLAVVYHSLAEFERAGELYRASLAAWEETKGTPPADYDIVISNYADLLRSLGKPRQARQLEDRAQKRRRR